MTSCRHSPLSTRRWRMEAKSEFPSRHVVRPNDPRTMAPWMSTTQRPPTMARSVRVRGELRLETSSVTRSTGLTRSTDPQMRMVCDGHLRTASARAAEEACLHPVAEVVTVLREALTAVAMVLGQEEAGTAHPAVEVTVHHKVVEDTAPRQEATADP